MYILCIIVAKYLLNYVVLYFKMFFNTIKIMIMIMIIDKLKSFRVSQCSQ